MIEYTSNYMYIYSQKTRANTSIYRYNKHSESNCFRQYLFINEQSINLFCSLIIQTYPASFVTTVQCILKKKAGNCEV